MSASVTMEDARIVAGIQTVRSTVPVPVDTLCHQTTKHVKVSVNVE